STAQPWPGVETGTSGPARDQRYRYVSSNLEQTWHLLFVGMCNRRDLPRGTGHYSLGKRVEVQERHDYQDTTRCAGAPGRTISAFTRRGVELPDITARLIRELDALPAPNP